MLKDRIHIEPPKLLYRDKDMKLSMDGSCCTLRHPDGTIEFWSTDLCTPPDSYYRHFRGTPDDPFAEVLPDFEWDYNGFKQPWPSGLWVQSFYQCDDGMLIGFTHREDLNKEDPDYPQNYHIGLSVSFDKGQHWKYLGDILGTCQNYISKRRTGGKYPNVAGVPFLAGKDGYFYVYFNEYTPEYHRYISGARFPMKESIEKIRRGECPDNLVRKYSGGDVWDTEPMFVTAAPMLPEDCPDLLVSDECGYIYDCHSDAAYCSALDKYMLAVQSARQLILFFSDDGAHWNDHVAVATCEKDSGLYYYSTIIGLDDEASDDFSTVGHRFCIHYTQKVGFLRRPGRWDNYCVDDYYSSQITIDTSN